MCNQLLEGREVYSTALLLTIQDLEHELIWCSWECTLGVNLTEETIPMTLICKYGRTENTWIEP